MSINVLCIIYRCRYLSIKICTSFLYAPIACKKCHAQKSAIPVNDPIKPGIPNNLVHKIIDKMFEIIIIRIAISSFLYSCQLIIRLHHRNPISLVQRQVFHALPELILGMAHDLVAGYHCHSVGPIVF